MHCIVHQEALYDKAVQLGDVINTVVKIINTIRSQGLKHEQF